MAEINYIKVDTLPNVEGDLLTFVNVYTKNVREEFQKAYKNATDVGYNSMAYELLKTEWYRRFEERRYYEETRKKTFWIGAFVLTVFLLVILLISDAVERKEREKKTETIECVSDVEVVNSVSE